MAKRANAKTVEVNASHVAYMSHPKEAAKLIEEAATSAAANTSSLTKEYSSADPHDIGGGADEDERVVRGHTMKDHITIGRRRAFASYIARPKDFAGSRGYRSAGTVRRERRHSQALR